MTEVPLLGSLFFLVGHIQARAGAMIRRAVFVVSGRYSAMSPAYGAVVCGPFLLFYHQ